MLVCFEFGCFSLQAVALYGTREHALQADVTLQLLSRRQGILRMARAEFRGREQGATDNAELLALVKADPYLRELDVSERSCHTLGWIEYVRGTLLELQPSVAHVVDMVDQQKDALGLLCKCAEACTVEARNWRSSLTALAKARQEEAKALEKQRKQEEKAKALEEKRAAKAARQVDAHDKRGLVCALKCPVISQCAGKWKTRKPLMAVTPTQLRELRKLRAVVTVSGALVARTS